MQNKTWGTIITWTYDQPPYLVNGTEMYNQLVQSYMAGAKFSVIFDYPQILGNPYGILTDDQFAAMEKFWNDLPTLQVNSQAEVAFVMPNDYGWGMRSLRTRFGGFGIQMGLPTQIWNNKQKLLAQYGTSLDIVYDDAQFPLAGKGYEQIYYWNQTL